MDDERQYLWDHFKFNAEQRLKGFNFFVLLSMFADGGLFTAISRDFGPALLLLLSFFIVILAIVFWVVDARSQQLLRLTIPGMKNIERDFEPENRLFVIDAQEQGRIIRFTFAFRVLLVCQLALGVGVAVYALSALF